MDYVNGNDATTATPLGWWSVAFTGGTAPAPAGDEVVTGATSGSTAKVTVIGTLSGGSWVGGDAAGTMYFYGKSAAFVAEQVDFAGGGHMHIAADFVYCAWKTITSGATAARITAGDIIRIAKSGAPTSMGDAEWHNYGAQVNLDSAQTANVDMCETAWTAAVGGDATVTRTPVGTTAKEGTYCMKIAMDAAPQANILQAYYPLPAPLDLSSYQKLSFWLYNSAVIADATTWEIALCSDALGAVVVDSFAIPAQPANGYWMPLTIAKTGGGNLGNNINSIALYTRATAPTASSYLYVDDFIACTTLGLNLQSLISKNSSEQGGTGEWYPVQSINGTAIYIDNHTAMVSQDGRGYEGASETVESYYRETTKTTPTASSTTAIQSIQEGGTSGGGVISFQGGYNPATNLRSGETFYDGQNSRGRGLECNTLNYVTINYLNFYRYYRAIYVFTADHINTGSSRSGACGGSAFYVSTAQYFSADVISSMNHGTGGRGIYLANMSIASITTLSCSNCAVSSSVAAVGIDNVRDMTIGIISGVTNNAYAGLEILWSYGITIGEVTSCKNNESYGLMLLGNSKIIIRNLTTDDNSDAAVRMDQGNETYLFNALMGEGVEVDAEYVSLISNSRLNSQKHDQTLSNNHIWSYGGDILSQAVTRGGASGLEWSLYVTSSSRDSNLPLDLSIAKIAVEANKLVTVKAYFTKDHATNIGAKLVCRGGQIAGVASDVTATKANDTNPEELTITFTPTEAGVVEIEGWEYYVNAAGEVKIDTMTITQAA